MNIEKKELKKADFRLLENKRHETNAMRIDIHQGEIKPSTKERIRMSKNRAMLLIWSQGNACNYCFAMFISIF